MAGRLHIRTFGCQMNRYDSDRMAELLGAEGYALTDEPDEADVVLVNTCSVRARPERKVQAFLQRFAADKRRGRTLVLGVTGCVAQQHGERWLARIPELDLVLGTDAIPELPAMVRDAHGGTRRCEVGEDPDGAPRFLEAHPAHRVPGISELVTVGKGCDNYCAYCIVPLVRGRERSRPAGAIVDEVRRLVEAGTREITLIGQNVNSYGRGQAEGVGFPALLDRVAGVGGLVRLRFTTSHPRDFSEELARRFGELPVLCDWLHLPFQAGADPVLKRMNRGYTAAEYRDKVALFREYAPEGAVGADCIVGFPGETDADFMATMDLVEAVRFDQLFSFKYSPRPGTASARLPDDVPAEVKAERLRWLQARQAEITQEKNRAFMGRTVDVLVEGASARGDQLSGRTTTNHIVNFIAEAGRIGSVVPVMVEEGLANSLRGRLALTAA